MLNVCPRCDYPLTGLPEDHACPECGLRYDRASRLYRHVGLLTPFRSGVGFLAGLWLLDLVFQGLRAVPPAGRPVIVVLAIAGAALMTWLIWYYHGVAREKRLIAILPEVLLIRLTRSQPREIAWADISRVTANRGNIGVSIFIRSTQTIENMAGVFRSKAETLEFANRAMQRGPFPWRR